MAVVKIVNETYKDLYSIINLINYATDKSKTKGLIGALGVNSNSPEQMIIQMITVKKIYEKKKYHRQARHIIVSFDKIENERITLENAYYIAYEIAYYYGNQYQICFGIHQDTDILHIHFVLNTVNYITGKLYSISLTELVDLKRYVQEIIDRYTKSKEELEKAFLEELERNY